MIGTLEKKQENNLGRDLYDLQKCLFLTDAVLQPVLTFLCASGVPAGVWDALSAVMDRSVCMTYLYTYMVVLGM